MTFVMVSTILVSTKVWNPQPAITTVTGWWANLTAISSPAPQWTVRVGGVPDVAAVLATGQVVVANRGYVEAFAAGSGDLAWSQDVSWALPAVDVVVVRQRARDPDHANGVGRGYAVLDPASGAVIWREPEADAVWAFADKLLDLNCDDEGCRLRARRHRDNGAVLWSVTVSAAARTLIGPNPRLAGLRDPAEWFAAAALGTPGPTPPVIGLPVGDQTQVIDTVAGSLVREFATPGQTSRAAIVGERVLTTGGKPGPSGCQVWITADDYRSGQAAWRRDGLDLGTSSGAGCEQRADPLGVRGHLVAVGASPAIVRADKGAPVWTGLADERVLATDGELAVVRGADATTVRVIDLIAEGAPTVWSGPAGDDVRAAVTATLVLIHDPTTGKITVLGHRPVAPLREFTTRGAVIGHGERGLLIASGRTIGFIPL